MPVYEFYCNHCHMIFNFFSRSINTKKRPLCPKCKDNQLSRRMSAFAVTGKATEDGDMDDLPIDEAKMEKAMEALAGQAESISDDDPRQAADLMRKFSDMTGMELGPGMTEALQRMESGEDPDQIEADLGDRLENEEPFIMPGSKAKARRITPPKRDETLYDL